MNPPQAISSGKIDRNKNMTVETKAMSNESEDSHDPTLETADGDDLTTPSADEAAGADSSLAEEAAAPEVADDESPNEEVASDEASDETDGDESSESGDDEEELDTEIRPEDLAEEPGGDNEYDAFVGSARPIEEELDGGEEEVNAEFDWYILKVQSNREKSICAALQRRVSVAGLDEYFKEIIVPTEDVAEFKNGKRRVVKRKLFPGYIVANMALNDETWFLVRETSGIGDFTGAAGKPTPMMPEEVDRIVKAVRPDQDEEEQIKTAIPFNLADRVRIKEGTFENFEGDVEGIDEANGRVTVTINIFGRSTPVELEHWQIEAV